MLMRDDLFSVLSRSFRYINQDAVFTAQQAAV
jgi:hypothetical protein